MKTISIALATMALCACLGSTAAEAGRAGSHRVGGHGPHGKGSHYVQERSGRPLVASPPVGDSRRGATMPREKIESLAEVVSLAAKKARSMSTIGSADGHASEVSEIATRIEANTVEHRFGHSAIAAFCAPPYRSVVPTFAA